MALREREIELKKKDQEEKANQFDKMFRQQQANTTATTGATATAAPKFVFDHGTAEPSYFVLTGINYNKKAILTATRFFCILKIVR